MARKKNRKGFVAIPVRSQLALGALNDDTVIAGSIFGNNLSEDLFVISADLAWAIQGLTAGEGPIDVGISHSDYSVAEVEENLSANVYDPSDLIAVEHSKRKVRKVGTFRGNDTEESLNDGKPMRRKIRFRVDNGKTLNMFAVNRSGAQLTSGAEVNVDGYIYGRWMF